MEPSRLPNLLLIGFQKCGTSALHYYLDLHPEIEMSSPKELDYFAAAPRLEALAGAPASEREAVAARAGNWERGIDWYASHFSGRTPVRGESSPSYTAPWHPDAAERIHATIPEAQLIALVRDPLEQIPSAWLHERGLGREPRPLERAIEPRGIYVERLRYRARLTPFLERFGRERLLAIPQRDLLQDRRETMRRAFAFLGVDESVWSERMKRLRHVSAAKTRRRRILERMQSSRLARPAYRLPGEAKWLIERVVSRPGSAGDRPALPPEARELISRELAPDVEWLQAELGVDTAGWLR